jgi:hypothetical protein
MSNAPLISPSEVPAWINYAREKNRVLFLWGPPGCAKSSTVQQTAAAIAAENNWTFVNDTNGIDAVDDPANTFTIIDNRAATDDSSDVKGFGWLDETNKTTTFLPPDRLPRPDHHGHQGILFLDDFTQAPEMVSAGYSQLILDGHVGNYHFPKGWQIVIAGNRVSDRSSAKKIGNHVLNRCFHAEMVPSVKDWSAFELAQGGDQITVGYVRARPEVINIFNRGDVAFCSMRSLSGASEVGASIDDPVFREKLVAGFVGTTIAGELEGYRKLIASGQEIPTWNQIVADPLEAPAPVSGASQEMALSYAIIGIIAHNISKVEEMPAVIQYLGRIHKDVETTCMHDLFGQDDGLFDCEAATQWRSDNPDVILGK